MAQANKAPKIDPLTMIQLLHSASVGQQPESKLSAVYAALDALATDNPGVAGLVARIKTELRQALASGGPVANAQGGGSQAKPFVPPMTGASSGQPVRLPTTIPGGG